MPLIIVTGLPCSGKSTTSRNLSEYLSKRLKEENDPRKVKIVTDADNLDWDGRDTVYMSIPKEKELRGWLRAEASRYLDQIVILDAAAYIKGFRYELHCLAREAKTHYCIVELLLNSETCWQWNENRVEQGLKDQLTDPDAPDPGYKRETFDALLLRYEKCDESNRWDSPLFRISKTCDLNDELLEKVYQAITGGAPLVPNKSTTQLMSCTTIYKPPH